MLLLALALAALQGAPATPRPHTLHVGAGAHFSSPAAALAAARRGDTLAVAPGVYPGGLVVRVPGVVLRGAPGAVLDGGGRGTVVSIDADSVQLLGFSIRNGGRDLTSDEAAVKLLHCRGCVVRGNTIERSLHGVYLQEGSGIRVVGNRIRGNPALPEARRGNGIHLFNSAGNELRGNVIRGTRDGMYFSFSGENRVEGNDVARVRYGLHYMYSNDNRFTRNRFTRNAAGAALMFSKRIVFEENTFSEHVGYRAYGILLQTSYEILAVRNRIEGNLIGVFLDMSSQNTFRENVIAGNGIGIDMIASAEDNTFTENVVAGNRTAVRKPDGAGENAWAAEGRGNYWGDRSVFDLDGDGIGDRPYQAADPFASLAGLRPVLEVFSGTPAAIALSWAERAFPVFGLPHAEDPAPLAAPPAGAPTLRQPGAVAKGRGARAAALSVLLLPLSWAGVRRARRALRP